MKIKNLYVIRHGETDWNKNQRFQGQTDIKLNDLGRQQALQLRPYLQQLQIEAAYSSPLLRAYETAEIATHELKLSIHRDERLRETNIGDAEGLTLTEVNEKFGEEALLKWRSYDERLLDFRFANGESKRQMMFRIREAMLEIGQNSNRSSLAIFSHGMAMRAMTFIFGSGVTWDHGLFSNGSIHHFIWSEDQPESLIYKGKLQL